MTARPSPADQMRLPLQRDLPDGAEGFVVSDCNRAAVEALADWPSPIGGVMAHYTTVGDYAATTEIDAGSVRSGAIASLAAFGDGDNALGAGLQNGRLVIWRRERGQQRVVMSAAAPAGPRLYLRMTVRDGTFYSFAASTDGRRFTPFGVEQNGDYLPPWDRGVRVALTVGGAERASARFGYLRVEPARTAAFGVK